MSHISHSLSGHIGTAGWTIPGRFREFFPVAGSHLARYAQRLSTVEINSSFHRDHKGSTYARWAAVVPPNFRFSVKLARRFTHEQALRPSPDDVANLLHAIRHLGSRWGALLVQLPPKLEFDASVVREFIKLLQRGTDASIVIEPRHATWSEPRAKALIEALDASLVIADPDRCGVDELIGRTAYYRLHGSPVIYESAYTPEDLRKWSVELLIAKESGRDIWCIFDNTKFGYATEDAFAMESIINGHTIAKMRNREAACAANL